MIIVGIDPGLDGAIARVDTDDMSAAVHDMPTFELVVGRSTKRRVDARALGALLASIGPDMTYIERVGAMPKQGVTSMFSFGFSAGIVEGAVASLYLPYDYYTPQQWQKLARVAGGKDGSRRRAAQLWPKLAASFDRKKDDGRSDALLIAFAGMRERGYA